GAALSRQFFDTPFDLAHGPLIRGLLLRLDADEHMLLIDQHHIISDGWSLGVLVREVSALYTAFSQGLDDPLAPLAIQYADYAVWQRAWLQGDALQAQLDYWKGRLADAPELLALPSDHPRPAVQSFAGSSVGFALSASLTEQLRQWSHRHGGTLFMTLTTAWGVLMSRMSGQSDVVIGTPVANRQRIEIEHLIGYFLNTLALRVTLDDEVSVAQLYERTKSVVLDAYAHQEVPLEQVLEAVNPPRSVSHNALFQTMLSLNNNPAGGELRLPGLRLSSVEQKHESTYCDLYLALAESGGALGGALIYATDLFEADSMQRLLGYFQNILEGMVADPAQAVSRLALVGAA
ncbi:non-ribosomal peptide synthetase, partial [Rugamonas sp. CCM 8940]